MRMSLVGFINVNTLKRITHLIVIRNGMFPCDYGHLKKSVLVVRIAKFD